MPATGSAMQGQTEALDGDGTPLGRVAGGPGEAGTAEQGPFVAVQLGAGALVVGFCPTNAATRI